MPATYVTATGLLTAGGQPNVKDAARLYAEAGAYVFPLHHVIDVGAPNRVPRCSCPQGAACESAGKHPRTRNGLLDASRDPATVSAWWEKWPLANVGLPADLNRLAIIDVDPDHGGDVAYDRLAEWTWPRADLSNTLTARTGRGGRHLYYAAPEGGIKSTTTAFGAGGEGLDTRGYGGYVVAPPSQGTGGRYEYMADPDHLQPWPEPLTRLMNPAPPLPQGRPATPPRNVTGWAAAALRGEYDQTANAAEGKRNNQLNASAIKLGRLIVAGQLDRATVEHMLTEAARASGLKDAEIGKTVRSGIDYGMAQGPRVSAPRTTAP